MSQKSNESTEQYNACLLFEIDAIRAYINVLCYRPSLFRESSLDFFAAHPSPWIFKLNHYLISNDSPLLIFRCYNNNKMASSGKDKATICFTRFSDGNVIGQIIDDARNVVESKSFGVMSIEEYERLMDYLNREDPKLAGKILPTIELTGN